MDRKWEIFKDENYFDLFAVRPKGDRNFNSPELFYFDTKEEAEAFKLTKEKE